ncbi:hypothetical protein [Maribacter sp. 2-571]|uniref:hypothetical protein n=1 Tax=Maribacter sp. 2-571 TaxID=3417569 RepID=UPI003D33993A
MKKIVFYSFWMLLLYSTAAGASILPSETKEATRCPVFESVFVGGWSYDVQGAPEGYENGFLLVLKEGKQYKAQVQVGDKAYMATDVVAKKRTLRFTLQIKTETIGVFLNANGSNFTGTVRATQGVFRVIGKKTVSAG